MSVIDNALRALFNMAFKPVVWTNASPASSFAAQDIIVDVSDAKSVEISYGFSTTGGAAYKQVIDVGKSAYILCWYQVASSGDTMGQCNRSVYVYDNKITFTAGVGKSTLSAADAVTNNSRVIPLKIRKVR